MRRSGMVGIIAAASFASQAFADPFAVDRLTPAIEGDWRSYPDRFEQPARLSFSASRFSLDLERHQMVGDYVLDGSRLTLSNLFERRTPLAPRASPPRLGKADWGQMSRDIAGASFISVREDQLIIWTSGGYLRFRRTSLLPPAPEANAVTP